MLCFINVFIVFVNVGRCCEMFCRVKVMVCESGVLFNMLRKYSGWS